MSGRVWRRWQGALIVDVPALDDQPAARRVRCTLKPCPALKATAHDRALASLCAEPAITSPRLSDLPACRDWWTLHLVRWHGLPASSDFAKGCPGHVSGGPITQPTPAEFLGGRA
jgi:hypothetical protein